MAKPSSNGKRKQKGKGQPTLKPKAGGKATSPPHTCGHAGGITKTGAPCRMKTSPGNRCHQHREEDPRIGGQQEFTMTDSQIQSLERLASVLSVAQLGDYFGFSESTFHNIKNRDPRVAGAYKRGRAQAAASIGSSLIRKALAGNTTAQIFYLKTQCGWRERDRLEVEDVTPRGPNMDHPDDMSDQQLMERLNQLNRLLDPDASPMHLAPIPQGTGSHGNGNGSKPN